MGPRGAAGQGFGTHLFRCSCTSARPLGVPTQGVWEYTLPELQALGCQGPAPYWAHTSRQLVCIRDQEVVTTVENAEPI